jgi:ABC-type cobalamin/Fe3+-siderophores transport system ATPase subunit
MEEIKLEIPRIPNDPNPINLTLKNGDQLFIVGPNGSGKSALIQRFVSQHPQNRVKRITAHRQTWFNSGSIDLTAANRQQYEQQYLSYDRSYEARWKDSNPGWNLSAVLFDLVAKENTRARAIARHVDDQEHRKAEEISAKSISPFDQINELLSLATLTVTIENSNDRNLIARHPNGQSFSIAEMSDGERNAMIIAAHVITADPGIVFLIDEPERHLHRSIIQPFLSALFDFRKDDCAFIIATHEISLPIANPEARVLMLRSCQWSGRECVAWDTEVIKPNPELPEELRRTILGSRNRILFVEGDSNSSLDFPLYTTLFPSLSMIPKGSCEDVQKAVLGLRGSLDIHDVEGFGLIDEDGRPEKDVEKLAESGIFALEVYSAESLYYCSDVIAAVAYEQARIRGEDGNKLIEADKQGAIEVIEKHAERMVARRCERRTRDLLLSKLPDWKSLKANPTQKICISADSPYLEELDHFNKLVKNGELDRLIARYPVRESSAFETIARSLRCLNKMDYERMVIARIRQDNELVEKLKKRIGPLSEALEQSGGLAIP